MTLRLYLKSRFPNLIMAYFNYLSCCDEDAITFYTQPRAIL